MNICVTPPIRTPPSAKGESLIIPLRRLSLLKKGESFLSPRILKNYKEDFGVFFELCKGFIQNILLYAVKFTITTNWIFNITCILWGRIAIRPYIAFCVVISVMTIMPWMWLGISINSSIRMLGQMVVVLIYSSQTILSYLFNIIFHHP